MVGNFNGSLTGKLYKCDALLYEKSYSHSLEYTAVRSNDRSWFEENFNASLSYLMGQLLADLELIKASNE